MDPWNQTMLGALVFSTVPILQNFAKVCKSFQKFAKVCKSLHATTKMLGTIQTDSHNVKEKNMD